MRLPLVVVIVLMTVLLPPTLSAQVTRAGVDWSQPMPAAPVVNSATDVVYTDSDTSATLRAVSTERVFIKLQAAWPFGPFEWTTACRDLTRGFCTVSDVCQWVCTSGDKLLAAPGIHCQASDDRQNHSKSHDGDFSPAFYAFGASRTHTSGDFSSQSDHCRREEFNHGCVLRSGTTNVR